MPVTYLRLHKRRHTSIASEIIEHTPALLALARSRAGSRLQTERLVRDALARLPPDEREALALAGMGLGCEEAGRIVGCAAGSFRSRLVRAQAALLDEVRTGPGRSGRADAPTPEPMPGVARPRLRPWPPRR